MLNIDDKTGSISAILTRYPENYCLNINREAAIASITQHMIHTNVAGLSFEEKLPQEINCIADQRKEQFKDNQILVVNVIGEIEPNFSEDLIKDYGDFVVCFDAVNRSNISQQSAKLTNLLISSLYLSTERYFEFNRILSGFHLQDEEGKLFYSFSLEVSGKCTISNPVSDNSIIKTTEYANKIAQSSLSKKVISLMSQALDENNDVLKSFLFAWSALEIFIQQAFKEYEQKYIDNILGNNPLILTKKYFERIKDVMKDKYRLNDKFIVLADLLCSETAEQDLIEFQAIKKNRDDFVHGEYINEDELPVRKTVILLKKYLCAYYDNMI